MIANFLVLVESLQGGFIRAFTFQGTLDAAMQRGREKAYEANHVNAAISAHPVANQ